MISRAEEAAILAEIEAEHDLSKNAAAMYCAEYDYRLGDARPIPQPRPRAKSDHELVVEARVRRLMKD